MRVVCISEGTADGTQHWEPSYIKLGEILTVCEKKTAYPEGIDCYVFAEDPEYLYPCENFRPIDYQYGHLLASEIEEEINEEQLILK